MISSSSSSLGTGLTDLTGLRASNGSHDRLTDRIDYSRFVHRLNPEFLPNFILLGRIGDAQHLQMLTHGVFPYFRLMLIKLATERANIAPSARTLEILDFPS